MPAHALRLARSRPALLLGLPVCVGLLGLALLIRIAFGAADIAPADPWQALVAFNPEATGHLVIQTLRIPTAVAALVGASLALAGPIGFVYLVRWRLKR